MQGKFSFEQAYRSSWHHLQQMLFSLKWHRRNVRGRAHWLYLQNVFMNTCIAPLVLAASPVCASADNGWCSGDPTCMAGLRKKSQSSCKQAHQVHDVHRNLIPVSLFYALLHPYCFPVPALCTLLDLAVQWKLDRLGKICLVDDEKSTALKH